MIAALMFLACIGTVGLIRVDPERKTLATLYAVMLCSPLFGIALYVLMGGQP